MTKTRGRFPAATTASLAAFLIAAAANGQTPGVDVADLGGLEARTAALILSGQEAGDLETATLAVPLPGPPGDSGQVRVALVVDVRGESLLVGADESHLVTELYAYAIDGEGGLGGVLTQAFRIDLGQHREALSTSGVKFLGHLDLTPGDYSLRVLVRHRRADRLRLSIDPLTVEPPRERQLLPPLFPEPADRWIVVRSKKSPDLPFPMVTGDRSWIPATRPGTADKTELYIAGRGLDDGLRAQVVDVNGEVLSELGLGDLRPLDGAPKGLEMVAAEIRTSDLDGGSHRLRLSTADGSAETSIALRVGASEAQRTVLAELSEAPVETATSGRQARVPQGRSLLELLDGAYDAYHEAILHINDGAMAKAMAAIIELERSTFGERLGDDTPQVQVQLRSAQVTVSAKLVAHRVESLVALIALHEKLYRQYHEHRHLFLANHTRQVLVGLGDLYLLRSRSPEAKRIVASAVSSLGGYFHELGARPAAWEIYQQALKYDDEHPATLLASAMLHEARSDYETAEEMLRKLVAEAPGDRRAKLHFAVNCRRQGSTRRAVKLLEDVIAAEATDWITALAYQELADIYAEDKSAQEGIKVLREAVKRMPDQQGFYLQLAALLDRAGQPGRATDVLQQLDARATTGVSASPRLIYTQPPASHFVRNRQILDDSVASRLPTLAETVNQLAEIAESRAATAEVRTTAGSGTP